MSFLRRRIGFRDFDITRGGKKGNELQRNILCLMGHQQVPKSLYNPFKGVFILQVECYFSIENWILRLGLMMLCLGVEGK